MTDLSNKLADTLTNTLTIGITGEIAHSHNEICEFLSKFHEFNCREMNIKLLLLATAEHGRLIPLLTTFSRKGLVFNKVVMTDLAQLIDVTNVMQVDMLMTTNKQLSENFKNAGLPVTLLSDKACRRPIGDSLHFAFDGDSVLFCHHAQLVADTDGINAFDEHEERNANVEMGKGPLFSFIQKVDTLQKAHCNIRWSLVTARGGRALKRAMHTIEQWQLSPAQCFFMEGSDKTPILKTIDSDIFFDDHPKHCERANGHMIVGHVLVNAQLK